MVVDYIRGLPIRMRLMLPIGIIFFGFAAAAWNYGSSMQDIEQQTQQQRALGDVLSQINRLKLHVVQALQYEKDFLLHHNADVQSKHEHTMQQVAQDIQHIEQGVQQFHLSLDTAMLKSLTQDYRQRFDEVAGHWRVIGLDEESGLRGSMRHTIHQVEAAIREAGALALTNSMLQMRRHEKDFLLREQMKYVAQMRQEHQYFDHLLQQSRLPDAVKQDLDQKVNAYQQAFADLVQGIQKNQSLLAALRQDIDKISPLLESFSEAAQVAVHQQQQKLEAMRLVQKQHFFTVLLVLFLIVSALLWLVSRTISDPLHELLDLVHGLAKNGNLQQRLEVQGDHELASMAQYINQLMEHLSNMLVRVQQSSEKINISSNQLAASSREQEATVTEQAVTAQQMAASSREIATTARTLQDNMENVTELARSTNESADQGHEDLQVLEHALRHMIEASEVIGEKFGMLNEKAANISQVVTTISKVADQTNLLSLNAAIEAEKAGEYGRGFSVVAAEIRRLANQTAITTVEIESIVKDMQSAVAAGVMGMDKFSDEIRSGVQTGETVSEQLQQVIGQIKELTPCIEDANEGLRNQVIGAQEISSAIEQLQTTTQQTQSMVLRTNQVIEDLNHASEALAEGMSQFKLRDS